MDIYWRDGGIEKVTSDSEFKKLLISKTQGPSIRQQYSNLVDIMDSVADSLRTGACEENDVTPLMRMAYEYHRDWWQCNSFLMDLEDIHDCVVEGLQLIPQILETPTDRLPADPFVFEEEPYRIYVDQPGYKEFIERFRSQFAVVSSLPKYKFNKNMDPMGM